MPGTLEGITGHSKNVETMTSKIPNSSGQSNGDITAALYGGRALHGQHPPAIGPEEKARAYYAAYRREAEACRELSPVELDARREAVTAEIGRRMRR